MPESSNRIRWEASLNLSERAIYDNLSRTMFMQASEARVPISVEDAMKCAAWKIQFIREHGMKAAHKIKIGKVPDDWPSVAEKIAREKVKRERRAAPGESEAEIQKAIVEWLVGNGWMAIRFNSGAHMIDGRMIRMYTIEPSGKSSGVSDLLAFRNGRHVFLEVKSAKGRLSDDQEKFAQLASQFGETVHVVRSVEDVRRIIQST